LSRHFKKSVKDPALTIGYGYDRPMGGFFAWIGPDGGDCEPEELVLDVGNLPGEVPDPEYLSALIDAAGHGALSAQEIAVLYADANMEGPPQRTPSLQALMDAMTGVTRP
jgi:hypothetical protein